MGNPKTPDDVSLGGETAKGTAAKFVTLGVGFVGSIVLARSLGPAAYGGFYALLAIVEIVDRPIRGWATAGKKRASESGADRDQIATALISALAVFLGIISAGALLAGDVLRSYADLSAAVPMFIALLVTTTLYVTIRALVTSRGLIGLATWTNTIRNGTAVPLQILFAVPLGFGLGAAGMAYGYAAGTLLVVPMVAYYAKVRPETPTWETVRSLWGYAKYSIPSGFLGRVYSRFDLLLIGALVGPASVGYYEIAYRISLPATFLSTVAASALLPRVSFRATDSKSFTTDVASVLSYSSLLSLPIFFGAVVIANDLVIVLYGTDYTGAGLLLIGIALYRIVKSQSGPLKSVVDGIDRPDYNLRLSAITLLLNVLLGVILILEYGAIGVVVATVIAESFRYLGLCWFLRREVPELRLYSRPILEQAFAAAAMCLLVLAALELTSFSRTVEVGFALVLGAVSYASFLLVGSSYHRSLLQSSVNALR